MKQLLDSQNIVYSEARAEAISILPLVLDGASVKSEGAEGWLQAWESLDLANSVTPATILRPRADLTAETVKSVLGGDAQAYALLQSAYSYAPLVVAVAEVDGGKVVTRLVGADSVGPINYGHSDPITGGNAKDAAQGRRRGRLRHHREPLEGDARPDAGPDRGQDRGRAAGQTPPAGTAEVPRNVEAMVEFTGLKNWQEIRARLMQVAGIQALEVNALSARAASVTFDYAGSLGKLQTELGQSGFALDEKDGTFVLRSK